MNSEGAGNGGDATPSGTAVEGEQEDHEEAWEPCEIDEAVRRLLGSISNERLTILCGAGLSMGEPSSLPSAGTLVRELNEYYMRDRGYSLTDEEGQEIESIAAWALENAPEFQNFFINTIRSQSFFYPPNPGHAAVADFLLTEAINSAISTNVDCLIEAAAQELGEHDFRAVVERTHLHRTYNYSLLVKLHGCFHVEEEHTVWCEDQLEQEPIRSRIEAFREWMRVELPGSDVLIIGYWTDWPYLNETFAESIRDIHPRSVTLVNPDNPGNLRDKAGELWEWVQQSEDINFHYVPATGNEFMAHFRREFSKRFFRHLLQTVQTEAMIQEYYGFTSSGSAHMPPFENMKMDDIYALRRDFGGVPDDQPATDCEPNNAHHERMGALHELLMERSASMKGRLYEIENYVLRLVNSRGRPLVRVKSEFEENGTATRGVDAYVCVGTRSTTPGKSHLVRDSKEDDVVRAGKSQEWWTDDQLFNHLNWLENEELENEEEA